ncbi:Uncharacterized protein SCF082_LOCUS38832 [Durusdinium trenchii]
MPHHSQQFAMRMVAIIWCCDLLLVQSLRPHEGQEEEQQRVVQRHTLGRNPKGNAPPAVSIETACQEQALDKGEGVTVNIIRVCVDALQNYAESTRGGLVKSIEAEKEFVKQYAQAMKKIKELGDVADVWDLALSDKNATLKVLLGDANATKSLTMQLRRNGTA